MSDKKQVFLEKVIDRLPKDARIADFGCGDGHFLTHLSTLNEGYALFGYDIKSRDDLNNIHYTAKSIPS